MGNQILFRTYNKLSLFFYIIAIAIDKDIIDEAGKNRISSLTIIAIVTPIAVSMVLLAMVYCLLRMSARKKSPMEEENGNEQFLFISLVVRVALI